MSRKKRGTSKPLNVELYRQVIHMKVVTGNIIWEISGRLSGRCKGSASGFLKLLPTLWIQNWVSAQSFTSSCSRLPLEYLYNFHISRLHSKFVKSLPFCSLKSESWHRTKHLQISSYTSFSKSANPRGFCGYRSFSIVMTLSTTCAQPQDDHWPCQLSNLRYDHLLCWSIIWSLPLRKWCRRGRWWWRRWQTEWSAWEVLRSIAQEHQPTVVDEPSTEAETKSRCDQEF